MCSLHYCFYLFCCCCSKLQLLVIVQALNNSFCFALSRFFFFLLLFTLNLFRRFFVVIFLLMPMGSLFYTILSQIKMFSFVFLCFYGFDFYSGANSSTRRLTCVYQFSNLCVIQNTIHLFRSSSFQR